VRGRLADIFEFSSASVPKQKEEHVLASLLEIHNEGTKKKT